MRAVSSFAAGLLFALGLGVSGMTDPANVLGFLDAFGAWKPALALVMVGALVVYFIAVRYVSRRGVPLLDTRLHLPTTKRVTPKLVAGSLLFGAGWGLSGYCPGPALVSLGALPSLSAGLVAFVGAMVLSAGLVRILASEPDVVTRALLPDDQDEAPVSRRSG